MVSYIVIGYKTSDFETKYEKFPDWHWMRAVKRIDELKSQGYEITLSEEPFYEV